MKTTTTTTDASAEDRQRVQGIEDDGGGGSRSTTGLVDWQRQRSVDFPCLQVDNSKTVLSLTIRGLVLILFSSDSFFFSLHEILSSRRRFCTKFTLTLRMYPISTGEFKKLQVHMINKYVRKSLERKTGN